MMSLQEAKQEVRTVTESETIPLDHLIGPREVDPSATSWEDIDTDKLEREINRSTSMLIRENKQIQSVIEDFALIERLQSLPRLPLRALSADTKEKALIPPDPVWCYKMDKWEAYETICENMDKYHLREGKQRGEKIAMEIAYDVTHPLEQ